MSARLTRRQAQQWLAPLRETLVRLRQRGEIDTTHGLPALRIAGKNHSLSHALPGFAALLARVAPACSISTTSDVARSLEAGEPITYEQIDTALRELRAAENALTGLRCSTFVRAAQTEEIRISMQAALREAA